MNRLLYEFLDHAKRRRLKAHTTDDYRRTIGEFFRFVNENYPDIKDITGITRDIVLSYEKYLITKKDAKGRIISRGRRRRYLSNLKTFFAYLQREERIYADPTVNIAIPNEKRRILKDVLTIEEMDKLIKICPGDTTKGLRDRAILELLYSAGIRADELCNIELEDIDLDEMLLFVRKGKLGSQRLIPFGQSSKYWIEKYLERARPLISGPGDSLLFVSMRGRKLDPQALLDIVKGYARSAGIEKNVTSHTFRHSCAGHMLKGGADIRYVQRQLGHRRISTTEKYLKIEITDLKEIHDRCHPREQEDWD